MKFKRLALPLLLTVILVSTTLFSCVSTADDSTHAEASALPEEQLLVGGYSGVPVDDDSIAAAREAALAALYDEGYTEPEIDLRLAATQVVTGLNVRFLGFAGNKQIEVLIYQDFDGATEVVDLLIGSPDTP